MGDTSKTQIVIAHPEVTSDTTTKEFETSLSRPFILESAQYLNPTGLVQDASNYFTIKILNGATVLASWSTLTGAQGTIAADTFVTMVMNATPTNLILDAATVISLFLDETGTSDLPAGKVVLTGRYV